MDIKKSKIKRIYIDAKTGKGDGHYTFDLFDELRPKKVSSTWIPQLLGEGGFSPKGDKLLEFWGLTLKDDFDKYYELRGAVAEDLLQKILEKKGHSVKRFPKDEFNYDYFEYEEERNEPLNKLYKYFSGLPDVVSNLGDELFLYEVKSKEYDKMQNVIDNLPEYEILQGKTLALLYGLNKVVMVWFFFSDEVSRTMRICVDNTVPFVLEKAMLDFNERMPNLTYNKDFFIHRQDIEFSMKNHLEQMKEAYKYAEGFRQTKTIKMSDLSKDMKSQIFKLEGEIEDEFKPKGRKT